MDTKEALTATAAQVVGFLMDFIDEKLRPKELKKHEKATLDQIRVLLPGFQKFVKDRWQNIRGEVKSSKVPVIECARCHEVAATIDDGVKCLFCKHTSEPREAAWEYVQNVLGEDHYTTVKDGGIWPIFLCPDCDDECLVYCGPGGDQNPRIEFICFTCGETWKEGELDFCGSCGQPYENEESAMCDRCLNLQAIDDP